MRDFSGYAAHAEPAGLGDFDVWITRPRDDGSEYRDLLTRVTGEDRAAEIVRRWNACEAAALRPMADAPRDGTYVLAQVRPDIADTSMSLYGGRWFVVRFIGSPESAGAGWALYPGFGGVRDDDFAGWLPAPAIPAQGTTTNAGRDDAH